MKKKVIITLLLTLIFSFVGIAGIEVSASNVLEYNHESSENEEVIIQPRIIAPCATYGIHRMELQDIGGVGIVNRTTNDIVMYNPRYYKCDCGEEAFTMGSPHYPGWDVREYITSGGFELIWDIFGGWLYVTDYTQSTVPYATSLLGYEFLTDMQ